jgi:membrane protein implicated in regulation of membrane protease activity
MLWLIIAIVLGIIEAVTLGVVTIWFAIGALLALIGAAIGFSLQYQIVIFLLSSGILLYYTRPIIKKYLKVGTVRTNADRLIGEKGVVTERIDVANGRGQVKVLGQIWSARSSDNQEIPEGERVEILDISGVKLVVKKLER